jgi:hypothetical protein
MLHDFSRLLQIGYAIRAKAGKIGHARELLPKRRGKSARPIDPGWQASAQMAIFFGPEPRGIVFDRAA